MARECILLKIEMFIKESSLEAKPKEMEDLKMDMVQPMKATGEITRNKALDSKYMILESITKVSGKITISMGGDIYSSMMAVTVKDILWIILYLAMLSIVGSIKRYIKDNGFKTGWMEEE